ncbi:MAG: Na+/H+ antiporter NhaA [Bacteroidota bacterium]|nr:Na+/H+ antiporter NhaA [Bacteroidota bacterium]
MIYKITSAFRSFARGQQFAGVLLIGCTAFSIILANQSENYIHFWEKTLINFEGHDLNIHWLVNELLMTFFFLLVGIEIKREFTKGELNTKKKAALPIAGAIGGMLAPAIIYYIFTQHTNYTKGWAIPTATDIAFTLTALKLAGNKIPFYIKIVLTSLAVADDLGAILLISVFYSSQLDYIYMGALALYLFFVHHKLKNLKLPIYIFSVSLFMIWLLLFKSGVHPSIAGVLLAFALPASKSAFADRVEQLLSKPVNYFIMPLFALANTAIIISGAGFMEVLNSPLAMGIIVGLLVGKPLGIISFIYISNKLKLIEMPQQATFPGIATIGIFAGIGFTMSIFVSIMAFEEDLIAKNMAIFSVVIASVICGLLGTLFVKIIPFTKLSK